MDYELLLDNILSKLVSFVDIAQPFTLSNVNLGAQEFAYNERLYSNTCKY